MQLNISNGTRLSNFFEWFYLVYFYPSGFQCFNTYGQLTIKFWTDFVLYHGRRPWPTDFFISICNLLITTIFLRLWASHSPQSPAFCTKSNWSPRYWYCNILPIKSDTSIVCFRLTHCGSIQLSSLFTIVIQFYLSNLRLMLVQENYDQRTQLLTKLYEKAMKSK